MLSPFYTATHVDAALAIRAGKDAVKGQRFVAYDNNLKDKSPVVTDANIVYDASRTDDGDRFKLKYGITIEGFAAHSLGTIQIGGIANVEVETPTDLKTLPFGTILFPKLNSSNEVPTDGTILTAKRTDMNVPVARVHHHEEGSNIAQVRLLHGLSLDFGSTPTAEDIGGYIGASMADTPPSNLNVNFAEVAGSMEIPASGSKRKRGFLPDLDEQLSNVNSARANDQFNDFFGTAAK